MGYDEVGDTRIGKIVKLKLDTEDREKARQRLDEMCRKLLANPIIENFTYELKEL
jgi:phosphoribosylformylglycinamidine synthase